MHRTNLARFFIVCFASVALLVAACKPVEPVPTCADGILNQDETDIDCGGTVCMACPTCIDGIMNQGEIGVDCGGPCLLQCLGTPPCQPAFNNTIDLEGLYVMYLPIFEYRRDAAENHVYVHRDSNYRMVELTFSKDYNFLASGMFPVVQYPQSGASGMHELAIRVSTASQVYFITDGEAYVQLQGPDLKVTFCNLLSENQFFSIPTDGLFTFPAYH